MQPRLSTSFVAIFTVVHLMLWKYRLLWSDLTLNMRLPHGTHILLVTFLNLIKSIAVLHVSPKWNGTINGPNRLRSLLWNWAGNTWPMQEKCSFNCSTRVSTAQLQSRLIISGSPQDTPDNVELIHFIPLSSRTNAYKYSFFPRTVSEWNALPDPVRSAPSTESCRAALCRSPTSTSSSCC